MGVAKTTNMLWAQESQKKEINRNGILGSNAKEKRVIVAKQNPAIRRGIMAGSFTWEDTCNRNVAKLMVDNYFSWALKVKQKLLLKDVWEAVIEYKDTPGYVLPHTETRRRARNNGDIAEIDSANKAWKKLDEPCNDGGLVNGAMNLKQLTHFVKPKDMSVQVYFAKINQLWKKTTKAGYEFERQVAGMIVGNLAEKFVVCVRSLEA
ncbi:hypothetical protein PR048_030443 [Dryococelus australis]|uniref:Uncharacterized protein n=1 Tax=Dryococelus australis TaxID=614101 RepID=A0ABQ9GBP9_9NEOP|nr:hypothetical protein PR048_030443 [Dryococelus australis]